MSTASPTRSSGSGRRRPLRRSGPMDERSTRQVLCMLSCLPNGVQAMSAEIHGLVQTSPEPGDPSHGGDLPGGLPSARSSVDSPAGDAEATAWPA